MNKFPELPLNGRALAWQTLNEHRQKAGYASDLIDRLLKRLPVKDVERRLMTELVFGTLRHRRGLDALIAPHVTRGFEQVDPPVQDALRLGAYQLAHLDHIPSHAAVNETVALVRMTQPKAAGFTNGVLRRVSELLTGAKADGPGDAALPLSDGSYRRLSKPTLPDPAGDPVGYLSVGFNLPDWLAARWLGRHGLDECLRLGFWFFAPPPTWLRCNRLRKSPAELEAMYLGRGVSCVQAEHPQALRLLDRAPVRDLPGFADGDFSVQDLTSMAPATALNPQPGTRVLDLCAAPGGKTTHLAELMKDTGEVVACDISRERLETLKRLAKRLKLNIIRPRVISPEDGSGLPSGQFDAALVDAPCSNTGVLGRRPEVRERLQERELPHLVALQQRLLRQAIDAVIPGAAVVYSTCSVEPEENRGVVDAALADGKAVLEEDAAAVPGRPSDGGYWARLRRK